MFQDIVQANTTIIDTLRQARIIIADELAADSRSLQAILTQTGCKKIIQTLDKEDIIKNLRAGLRYSEQAIDLLVLSTTLNNFDVQALTREIASNSEMTTPVILLGNSPSWWDENQLAMAYDTGALDLITRPLRNTEVIPRIILALRYSHEWKNRIHREENLITELSERKVMETRLNYLLNHDELTALPSRHRLEAALKIAIGKAINMHRMFSLIYVDIDNFRLINENLGHQRGDKLLTIMGNRIQEALPVKAMVARVGSDEFGILLDDSQSEDILTLAENIHDNVETMVCGDTGKQMRIKVNIGILQIDAKTDINTASDVLARGEQACNIAKTKAGKSIFLYRADDPALRDLQKNRKYVTLIREALVKNWFELYAQPIVSLKNNQVSHYEILIRLQDDSDEFHSPADFIPVAESNGLIDQLDFWVVDHAIDMLHKLSLDHKDIKFSINLSADGLQNTALLDLVRDKITFHGLNPAQLMFELTETAAVKDVVLIRENIAKLRAMGCRFAIDDFGSGFSSYTYIKNYPVDFIKIDGIFIRNLLLDESDQILVKSMIDVAHSLKKRVVAEYVESAEISSKLADLGADCLQGYHLGKPQPVKLLHRQHDD